MMQKLVIRTILWTIAQAAILFLAAGTWRWPGAWAYLILMFTGGLWIGLWLARHDPALLAERLAPPVQPDQKGWDKAFIPGLLVLVILWLVVMGLDAGRYQASHVPPWLQAVGALAITATMYIGYLSFRENTFAAPVVKIQAERGHRVVTTGPYAHVRHPLYAGAILYLFGIPLLLGSWYGLLAAPILIAALALRAVKEEQTLCAELPGYAEYAANVRYRLIPMVW
jgi:protein-S-isoprenylcysteine O-methyltransferase Ste14